MLFMMCYLRIEETVLLSDVYNGIQEIGIRLSIHYCHVELRIETKVITILLETGRI